MRVQRRYDSSQSLSNVSNFQFRLIFDLKNGGTKIVSLLSHLQLSDFLPWGEFAKKPSIANGSLPIGRLSCPNPSANLVSVHREITREYPDSA